MFCFKISCLNYYVMLYRFSRWHRCLINIGICCTPYTPCTESFVFSCCSGYCVVATLCAILRLPYTYPTPKVLSQILFPLLGLFVRMLRTMCPTTPWFVSDNSGLIVRLLRGLCPLTSWLLSDCFVVIVRLLRGEFPLGVASV